MQQPGDQQSGAEGQLEALAGAESAFSDSNSDDMVTAEVNTPLSCDAAAQTEAPAAHAAAVAWQLRSPVLAAFLRRTVPLCEEALQQNELADPLLDALADLVDEEVGDAGTAAGPGASAHTSRASSAAGLVEHQSFSDLLRSKGRPLAAACFHPSSRGVVAVAVGNGQDVGAAAPSWSPVPHHAQPSCILIWRHNNAIHPEAVLHAPAEVTALAWHPTQQHVLAVGLCTGQVALFNLQAGSAGSGETAAPPDSRHAADLLTLRGQTAEGVQEGSSHTAALLPLHLSMPEASHQASVSDLHWLPGVALSRDGHLEAAAPCSEACGDAASTGAGDGCTLFASCAIDGALLCWDMRISARHRKQTAKEEELPDWKPALALAAAGAAKQPLLATRFCVDASSNAPSAPGRFVVGDLAGELAVVDAASYNVERRGSKEWEHNTVLGAAGRTGRVLALQPSPFFQDVLLVVGDCGFVLWRLQHKRDNVSGGTGSDCGGPEGAQAGSAAERGSAEALLPIFESRFPEALYSNGCWSPTRPGVVILSRQDGQLEVWDLVDRTHQPCMVAPVAPCALTTLAVSPLPAGTGSSGSRAAAAALQVLAVGDASGMLRLLELPRALRRRGHAEVKAVASLLARERAVAVAVSARLTHLAAQQRTAQAAAQAAARKVHQEMAAGSQDAAKDGGALSEAAVAERRYLALEAEWRARLLSSDTKAAVVGRDASA